MFINNLDDYTPRYHSLNEVNRIKDELQNLIGKFYFFEDSKAETLQLKDISIRINNADEDRYDLDFISVNGHRISMFEFLKLNRMNSFLNSIRKF
jgi:hypothetical protein